MKRDIIAIGASAGGIEALKAILSRLPADLPAAIFVTVHTLPTGPGLLANVLDQTSPLRVVPARENDEIQYGNVYVAVPNLHLIVKRGHIKNMFLPKENGTRPAIDPMFRSTALNYARRVIGVLLTGNLDDGTAGLGVIRDEGGVTIVQDPKDAKYPDMPLAAVKTVKPDYVLPLAEIPPLLLKLVNTNVTEEVPKEILETKETSQALTCPGCGGILQQYVDNELIWYKCQIGHRFTSDTILIEQNAIVEEHFWRLLSILKEKETIARTMADDARHHVDSLVDAQYYEAQVQAAIETQMRLAKLLNELGPQLFPANPKTKTS